jgi:hypothetical protein
VVGSSARHRCRDSGRTRLLDPAVDSAPNARASPLLNDALLTWSFILGGMALGVYGLIAFEGTMLAMLALTGAEIFVGGIGRVMRA